jgi:hypothetical protein
MLSTRNSRHPDSYRHLREHGNSFFMVSLEIVLGLAFFGAGRYQIHQELSDAGAFPPSKRDGDFSPAGFIQAYILTVDSEYKELIEAGFRMAKESRKMVRASQRNLEQIKRDQKSLKDEIDSVRESLRHQRWDQGGRLWMVAGQRGCVR